MYKMHVAESCLAKEHTQNQLLESSVFIHIAYELLHMHLYVGEHTLDVLLGQIAEGVDNKQKSNDS